MQIRAKYKICRRLGAGVFEKCQTGRYAVNEQKKAKTLGKKGGGKRGGGSDFGKQLIAKQRVRFTYGLAEKQFARYAKLAMEEAAQGQKPATRLFERLETRLDNVIYRAGLAPTRRAARQMASHGHVTVDGRRVTIPSYEMHPNTAFAVRPGSRVKPAFSNLKDRMQNITAPAWMSFDASTYEGAVKTRPSADAAGEIIADIESALEFYSR